MPDPIIPRPTETTPGFSTYIALVPETNLLDFLTQQLTDFTKLLRNLPEKEALLHHAPYTWSIKQVVGHIIDTERIFAYRALRIARNDSTPLPSFDQDAYVKFANFDRIPLAELLEEFERTRQSNLLLFQHIESEAWPRRGTASNNSVTAATFAYAIAGHTKHHLDIIRIRLA